MKSPFQDIVPPEKRSIRNVSLSREADVKHEHHKRTKKSAHEEAPVKLKIETVSESESIDHEDPWQYESKQELSSYDGTERSGVSRFFIWIIALCCLVALFFSVSWLFSGASVTVGLKKINVPLSGPMNFSLSPSGSEVGYSTLTLSDKASAVIAATGEKQVNSSAKGTVVIYNNYNTSPQKLVTGTRLQLSDGLIYKLDNAVTVPGKSGKTPGSVTAEVTAEKAGSQYNIGLSDFTIPGFKGDPRFDAFYARSKTPMAGGGAGTVAVVDEAAKVEAVENLKTSLLTSLEDKVRKELPPTSTAFSGLEDVSYTVSDPTSVDGKAQIEITGTIKLYVIDTQSFARALLISQGTTVNPKDTFSIETGGASATTTSTASSTLTATFTGSAFVHYTINPDDLKHTIAGKSKDEVLKVVAATFPQISTISSNIKPFWRVSMPEDVDRITVIEE